MLETTLKMEKNARCSDLFVAEDELPHITKLHDKGFLSSSRACTQFSFQPKNVAKVLITVSFESRFYSCCKLILLTSILDYHRNMLCGHSKNFENPILAYGY